MEESFVLLVKSNSLESIERHRSPLLFTYRLPLLYCKTYADHGKGYPGLLSASVPSSRGPRYYPVFQWSYFDILGLGCNLTENCTKQKSGFWHNAICYIFRIGFRYPLRCSLGIELIYFVQCLHAGGMYSDIPVLNKMFPWRFIV